MQTITVKKKKYIILSPEEIRALDVASSVLNDLIEDEELTEEINSEACASVRGARDIVLTILNLNEIEVDLY